MAQNSKAIIKHFTIAASLLISSTSFAGDAKTINIETCMGQETRAEAKPCLEKLYSQSMDMAKGIMLDVKKNKPVDTSSMSAILRREYNGFSKTCLKQEDSVLKPNETPEDFLRDAQICLSIATNTADNTNTEYNFDRASQLIAESRRSRRLDF